MIRKSNFYKFINKNHSTQQMRTFQTQRAIRFIVQRTQLKSQTIQLSLPKKTTNPLIKFHIANAYIYYINNHNPIHGIQHVIQYPIVGTYVCPVGRGRATQWLGEFGGGGVAGPCKKKIPLEQVEKKFGPPNIGQPAPHAEFSTILPSSAQIFSQVEFSFRLYHLMYSK